MADVYYRLTTAIRKTLLNDTAVNTVTYGNFDGIDIAKQTIFPLSHFQVASGTYEGGVWTMNLEIACLDIVDFSKTDTNNRDDVLNTQLAVITRLLEMLKNGDLNTDMYQLSGLPTIERIENAYENGLTGWKLTVDIQVPNLDIGIC